MNYSELPVIENERIRLRPITDFDTDLIVSWRNKEDVKKNFLYRSNFTVELHKKWLKEKVYRGGVIQFIIEYKLENNLIPVGSVYLRDIDYELSSAEFGIFIGEEIARKKGIGTLATRIITEFGHTKLNLHRIFLRLISDNISAYKAYRSAGFVLEGVFRDMRKINGNYIDIMFMSSIKQDS